MDACFLALALSLCLAAPADAIPNLNFSDGTLAGWTGQGFAVVEDPAAGKRKRYAVTSADGDRPGRRGTLERTLTVPADAVALRGRVAASTGGGKLDVLLLLGNQYFPKRAQVGDEWQPAPTLLQAQDGQAPEYEWPVAGFAGKTLRLVLKDDDDRRGAHLYCSGFRFLARADVEALDFGRHMVRLQKQHNLNAMARYDSAHFTALSNADEEFSRARLKDCEMLYRRFFDHFCSRGVIVKEPPTKLMVAIFDNEAGFKAYLGPNELRGAQGFYHTQTNRLIIYDYRQNLEFQANRKKAETLSKQLRLQLNREQYLETVERQAREFAADQNISLIVHEVAHQLAFNGGLFNRQGDAPFWAVEGHANYCESTEAGRWLGIGKPNPERLRTLARVKGQLVPLRRLVTGDGWKGASRQETLLFYAQSWALFQMLMEERPQVLFHYLRTIYSRQTADHRLTDFREAFGADLEALDKRLAEYVRRLLEKHPQPRP